jgi:hypothetical protein
MICCALSITQRLNKYSKLIQQHLLISKMSDAFDTLVEVAASRQITDYVTLITLPSALEFRNRQISHIQSCYLQLSLFPVSSNTLPERHISHTYCTSPFFAIFWE